MFAEERRNRLLQMLNEKRSVSVPDAALHFDVTEETIRRDMKLLESSGFLQRTHGGAILADDAKTEPSLAVRQGINMAGKDRIGRCAAGLVLDGDTIILDASTSALSLARHLRHKKNLTVITNAEKIVLELSPNTDITLIATGGILRHQSLSYVGRAAEGMLAGLQAGKAFLSCKGFNPLRGFTDSSEPESEIRRQMIRRSQQIIYLCDHTKLDHVGFVTTATLSEVDILITDAPLPEGWGNAFAEAGIKVMKAE
jgi:DeoR/GlpR family transcriptional regulator of sugar metabolism